SYVCTSPECAHKGKMQPFAAFGLRKLPRQTTEFDEDGAPVFPDNHEPVEDSVYLSTKVVRVRGGGYAEIPVAYYDIWSRQNTCTPCRNRAAARAKARKRAEAEAMAKLVGEPARKGRKASKADSEEWPR